MSSQMVCELDMKNDAIWPAFPVALKEAVGARVDGVLYVGLGTAGRAWYALDTQAEQKSWQRLADFPAEAPNGAASAVVSGKIYVFGGAGRVNPQSSLAQFDFVHCYDPLSDSWAKLPTRLPVGMLGASAISADGVHVLVFGGYNKAQFDGFFAKFEPLDASQQGLALREFMSKQASEYEWNADVWQFDVTTLEWQNLGRVPHQPNCGSAVISHQGQIYLLSGEVKPGLRSGTVKRALISNGGLEWIAEKNLPSADGIAPQEGVAGGFAGRLGDDLVLAGGTNFPGAQQRYDALEYYAHQGLSKTWRDELYVFRDDVWIMAGKLPVARANGLSFQVEDGLLLVGGDMQDGIPCTESTLLPHNSATAFSQNSALYRRNSSVN
ncbi:YjhT family mutarotase [Glaciimonas soli]|uniref:YjhT family mutarotase n=1 Tax=Glaciimonas soli TaxID=2590999 RepID=A0A843YY08_9BURK|nr:YjhT family mutarotase [Glaciimonas soli]MQR02141.1 YjhT family mutarotase [Glaciimonas soli]